MSKDDLDLPETEIIDLDERQFVSLEASRVWPKYRITWSIRRRTGDSDFPLASGMVESLPRDDAEEMWRELRSQALDQAMNTAPAKPPRTGTLLSRLLGRR